MPKIAFIYPGQGVQYVGMGQEIFNQYKEAREVFKIANDVVGYDIERMCFEGSEEDLKKTEHTQPAILTTCIAITKVLLQKKIYPAVAAGLSLGEYAALVVAEAIEFQDAVSLVKKRGKFMQETVPLGLGAMAAILGMEREALEETLVLAKKIGVVEAANFNCPGQIVISGEKKAVERACEIAKEKGALKAVLLPVSAPFHSSMLKPAGAKLGSELEKIDISPLKIPVIANANADYYKNNMEVKGLLVEQVSKAVLWEDSVIKMFEFGIDTFIEIGPGKSLSQFVKKIAKNQNKNVMIYNVEDVNTLNILTQALSAI